MKRNSLVEYEDAAPEVKELYDEIMDTMGSPTVLNFLMALGNNPNVLRAVWSMLKGTVIAGEIPALLKQLILFKISINIGNEYCTALHGHAALSLAPTLTYDDLVSLSDGSAVGVAPSRDADLEKFLASLATAWQEGEGRPMHHEQPKSQRYWRTRLWRPIP